MPALLDSDSVISTLHDLHHDEPAEDAAAPSPAPEVLDAGPAPSVPAPPQVPYDVLFPRRDKFRDKIVENLLPKLERLLRDPTNRLANPRDLVNKALDICKANDEMFWGEYGVYTRKRSVCDAVLAHYFQELQAYVTRHTV